MRAPRGSTSPSAPRRRAPRRTPSPPRRGRRPRPRRPACRAATACRAAPRRRRTRPGRRGGSSVRSARPHDARRHPTPVPVPSRARRPRRPPTRGTGLADRGVRAARVVAMTDLPTVRATGPADLLALVPGFLGFHPEDSVVLDHRRRRPPAVPRPGGPADGPRGRRGALRLPRPGVRPERGARRRGPRLLRRRGVGRGAGRRAGRPARGGRGLRRLRACGRTASAGGCSAPVAAVPARRTTCRATR